MLNHNNSLPLMPTQNGFKHHELPIENGIDYKNVEIKFIDICETDDQPNGINEQTSETNNKNHATLAQNKPHIHNIEIFLSQAAKINVTDGIINMKSKSSTNGNCINTTEQNHNEDLNEDSDEFPKGIRIKNWFSEKCNSNSSLNGSISSATSSASKLTVFIFICLLLKRDFSYFL